MKNVNSPDRSAAFAARLLLFLAAVILGAVFAGPFVFAASYLLATVGFGSTLSFMAAEIAGAGVGVAVLLSELKERGLSD